jgi:ATP-dependent RNA helicase DHX36
MLKEYNREQRSKEFKETQVRLRKEVGHLVDEEMLDFESSNGKLSRRRRTRLKAAERAFDRDAKEKKLEEERRKLQTERLDRIKHENSNMRQLMADKAILRREMEQHEQEIRKVSRAAMNAAFNGGESTEDARKAARDAELKYRREHGLEPAMDRDTMTCVAAKRGDRDPDGELEKQKESDDTRPKVSATQSTILFMDRLREMYSNAVSQKGACSLAEPRGQYSSLEDPGQDEEKKLPRPIAVPVGDLARIMEDEVVAVQKDRPWLVAPEARFLPVIDETDVVEGGQQPDQRKEILNRKLLADLEWSLQNPSKKVQKIREETQKLPAFEKREQIVSTICANQVTLISASTGALRCPRCLLFCFQLSHLFPAVSSNIFHCAGAGKTTIVPGLLLNHMIRKGQGAEANIIVTQPRRISAIGVAERIASERGEKVGETCGYSIKLERKCSKKTKITLCTTGILLRRLQCDPDLATVSHVIVDEVHERDLNTDFALIILKELLKRRPSLKLVLMSATLDKDIFATYFEACATVSITGRAFPVREYRLEDILELTGFEVQEGSDYAFKENNESKEARLSKTALKKLYYPKYSSKTIHSLSIADESVINYELVAELVQHICCRMVNGEEGAILIFMPGMVEISSTIDELYKKEYFQSESVIIYPLHSSLSTNEQTRVFEVPPSGTRKIVVATNIAETSITIPDVLYVVDCGRVKENRRDEVKEAPALVECWVSRASAQQRRGRAGRVQPGFAYHLFSSHTYDTELQDYQLPEMLRVGLEDLALQILILDLGEPSAFLGNALSPPTALAMKNSLRLLKELGAIECEICESDEESGTCADLAGTSTELTALGFHLATLPVEPRIGKLVLYGALFNCLDPALTIAASMSSKSPFVSPFDNRDAANEARQGFSVDDSSDHLTVLTAFDRWKDIRSSKGDRKAKEFARESFLSLPTLFQMEELRKQFSSLLKDIGFLTKGLQLGGKNRGGPKQQSGTTNGRDMSLVKGVLLAGLYPNVIVAPRSLVDGSSEQQAGEMAFQSRSRGNVYLHPCTLSFSAKRLGSRYCCFREIVQTKKLYVRDATAVSPVALLLFGGALHVYHDKSVISVDEWLKFRVERKSATLVKHLRGQMENMLLRKIVSPQEDVTSTPEAKALISSVSTLLQLGSEEIILDSASQKQSGSREGSRLEDNRGDPRRRNGGRGRVGGRMSARARGPPCADQSRQLPH